MDRDKAQRVASRLGISVKLVEVVARELADVRIVDRRGSWYYLSDGSKVQGRKNLPEGIE